MHHILVLGAGNIGSLITFLLAHSNDYYVYLADLTPDNPHLARLGKLPNFEPIAIDATDTHAVAAFIKKKKITLLVSSLPFYFNIPIATLASTFNLHYFDLTEDVKTTQGVRELSKKTTGTFVPQCGLAPGFISIVAHDLMRRLQ